MLTVYHGDNSVCSQKVRLCLAEKGLEWESRLVDMKKSEQLAPDYLKLNPDGVVPTLVQDGFVLRESSVILDYLDTLGDGPKLMPQDPQAAALARLWLIRCLSIHDAVNSMSFASYIRDGELKRRSAEEIEAWIVALPNPQAGAKRRDLMEKGPDSVFVDGAMRVLGRVFEDMQRDLEPGGYMGGAAYGLVDTALTAYVDRLDRLAMDGLWQTCPAVAPWLARMRERPSYDVAIEAFTPPGLPEIQRESGARAWEAIVKRTG